MMFPCHHQRLSHGNASRAKAQHAKTQALLTVNCFCRSGTTHGTSCFFTPSTMHTIPSATCNATKNPVPRQALPVLHCLLHRVLPSAMRALTTTHTTPHDSAETLRTDNGTALPLYCVSNGPKDNTLASSQMPTKKKIQNQSELGNILCFGKGDRIQKGWCPQIYRAVVAC